MEAPLREIVTNCGDVIKMGILDPTKVTRTALQNAASIAGHGGGGMGGMDF